jgi:GH25 family lysozyme M1 (1,4-beta-N-acetylmuramidase)
MTDIRMADISEFQSNVDAPAYLKQYKCIICRTYSGYRPDKMMTGRRDYLRGQPFTGLGWYAYLAPDRDPAQQAREFINTVGSLKPNEWPILDLEEGSGNQTSRAEAWFKVVDPWAGFPAMLYSGDYFLKNQLSGAGHWSGRPLWIAAYQSNEPTAAHILWQFSDAYTFAGIGACDGNLAHMSAQEFISKVRGGKVTPDTPQPITEDDMISAVLKKNGAIEVFVEKSDGRVYHTWQKGENGKWYSTDGKTISWQSMGNPGGK